MGQLPVHSPNPGEYPQGRQNPVLPPWTQSSELACFHHQSPHKIFQKHLSKCPFLAIIQTHPHPCQDSRELQPHFPAASPSPPPLSLCVLVEHTASPHNTLTHPPTHTQLQSKHALCLYAYEKFLPKTLLMHSKPSVSEGYICRMGNENQVCPTRGPT